MKDERTKLAKQCEEQNLVLQQRETLHDRSVLQGATGPTEQSHTGEAANRRSVLKTRDLTIGLYNKLMCMMTESLCVSSQ